MHISSTVVSLRQVVAEWRDVHETIAFVPTMGNLHDGHIELVKQASQNADRTVVSIFVNPTQFGPNEDFNRYPRTEAEDVEKLVAMGVDLLFLPSADEIYPHPMKTRITVSPLSSRLCGISRPGHFDGVALVVCKLLNIVQPDKLIMGEKDFQQLAIIRQMALDLNMPVSIHGVPTHREPDGLAMSSRNAYLTEEQRRLAPLVYQVLCKVRASVLKSDMDFSGLIESAIETLTTQGFKVDYFEICRQQDLEPASASDADIVVLAAAYLGNTRLIDNIYFTK